MKQFLQMCYVYLRRKTSVTFSNIALYYNG